VGALTWAGRRPWAVEASGWVSLPAPVPRGWRGAARPEAVQAGSGQTRTGGRRIGLARPAAAERERTDWRAEGGLPRQAGRPAPVAGRVPGYTDSAAVPRPEEHCTVRLSAETPLET